MSLQNLINAARDRRFDDWATTVTLRQVSASYSHETQQVSEVYQDTELSAIIGSRAADPADEAAGRHHVETVTLTLKAEDLRDPFSPQAHRMLVDGMEFDVAGFDRAPGGATVLLHCRRRS